MLGKVVAGRFQLKEKMGSGSFGEIYIAHDLKTLCEVALKIDLPKDRTSQLSFESKIYTILNGSVNLPNIFWFGSIGSGRNGLAIDLLGRSLHDVFMCCGRKFSLKTVLMLAEQMISSLEYVHTRHFIHRDVKPENFVLGRDKKKGQVYLIDFGLSKKFRDPKTLEHNPYVLHEDLTGTARYASVNALRGIEQSRRDDMESLGYVFVYFLKGFLPWMGRNTKDIKKKNAEILSIKHHLSVEELCNGLPVEFANYLKAVKSLKFTQKPDYSEYRRMFRDLFINQGFVYDYKYDWDETVSPSNIGKKTQKRRRSSILKNSSTCNILHSENKPENNFKKTPIIHNIRLVPNYETGNKNNNTFSRTSRGKSVHVKVKKTIYPPKKIVHPPLHA